DTIKLAQRSIMLGEIKTEEKNETESYEKEKIVINVRRELGDNGLEILENIPMVNVDIDGNVSLLGKQKTEIYIDGRPIEQAGYFSTEDLKTLSVAEIQKIEIITTPTIEYAEAMDSGIINIVTKKVISTKYIGNLTVGANTKNNLSSGIQLRMNNPVLSPSVNYNFNRDKNNVESIVNKVISLNDTTGTLEQKTGSSQNSYRNSLRGALNYNPSADDNIMANISYQNAFTKNIRSVLNNLSSERLSAIDINNTANDNRRQQSFVTFGTSYFKKYSEKGKMLMLNLMVNDNFLKSWNDINRVGSSSSVPISQKNYSANYNKTISLYGTYSHPLASLSKISIRFSSSYKLLDMKNDYSYDYNQSGNFIEDLGKKDGYKNESVDNNVSVYYSNSLWDIRYDFGLQLKNNVTVSSNQFLQSSFKNTFTNLSPSITLSKNLEDGKNINLFYKRLYLLPYNKYLNPNKDYSDTTNIKVGNPNLKPSTSDSWNLMFSIMKESHSIMFNLYYSTRKNIVEQITTQNTLTSATTTYQNIARSSTFGLSLSGYFKLFDIISLSPTIWFSNYTYEGCNILRNGSNWNSILNASANFNSLRFQILCYYSSADISAQSEKSNTFSADATVKMLFFDRALSVTLKISDIFDTSRNKTISAGTNFIMSNNTFEKTRIFSLNLSYYFQSNATDEMENDASRSEYSDDF
ncbi:MAG: outer membrane beta-barrel family protein, partial [Ignavibacteria bacterium]|nr:outer membrane beta-barrel family protein [Ignavibacteria bacterium]